MRGSIFTTIVNRSLAALIALLLMIPCGCGGGSGSDGSVSDAVDLLFCAMFPWTCFGNSSSSNTDTVHESGASSYIVGGTVSGLSGFGLVLQNNGSNDLTISASGTFSFSWAFPDGEPYTISVKTQPQSPSQTCTANNNTGVIAGTNVTSISVVCSTNTYMLGGMVTGLTGSGLVLQNNGGDDLAISSNSTFTFAAAIADGAFYKVTVKTQPAGQTCLVSNGNGRLLGAEVTNVSVVCLAWTRQMGVAGKDTWANGVVIDSSNNVYVTGYTSGGLDGNTPTGTTDFFLVKYDSVGNKIRTTQMGVAGKDTQAYGVAVDSSNNVYVTGWTNGGLDGNTLTGTKDFFLAKYDSAGNKILITQMGVAGKDTWANGVAVDSSGNVYVTGNTNGGLDGNTLTGTNAIDFFLTQYNSTGNKVRTIQMGDAGFTYASRVAVDSCNNVYVTGRSSSIDLFLVKYDSSENNISNTQMGRPGATEWVSGIAVDSSNDVYVTGYSQLFGGLDGNTVAGGPEFFLVKYDSSGNKIRITEMGGVSGTSTWATGVAVDSNSNAYVTGWTNGRLDGNTLTGWSDFFLVKYDSSGNKILTTLMGVAGKYTWAAGVAVDSLENVYVAGNTNGGLDGNTQMGTYDVFLTKYHSSANIQ